MTEFQNHRLTDEDEAILLAVARKSIEFGISENRLLPVNVENYSEVLRCIGATFVTLHCNEDLRGCIGRIQSVQPLICDVAENAWSAAMRDSRFAPMSVAELVNIVISVSVLSDLEEISFDCEAGLLKSLRPGIDGIVLSDGEMSGVFLPIMWSRFQNKADFLSNLKCKAGFNKNYWSDSIVAERFEVFCFTEAEEPC